MRAECYRCRMSPLRGPCLELWLCTWCENCRLLFLDFTTTTLSSFNSAHERISRTVGTCNIVGWTGSTSIKKSSWKMYLAKKNSSMEHWLGWEPKRQRERWHSVSTHWVDDVEQRLIVVDEEEERKGAEFEETKDEVIAVVDNLRRRFSSRSTGIFRRCLWCSADVRHSVSVPRRSNVGSMWQERK